ncbi:hypothetical protein [Streptomyces acidiscabies]|uniref:hypothetical protein n=1 Tax=Streptomyces acidiscabies TaxID=42234 RepID=UPI00067DB7A8|nr:hypothetical protein [Streptomyces acidiscabies]
MEVPTPLNGYAHPGHAIAPAEHHLTLPGFWPAYLAASPEHFEEFGADPADVDAAYEVLYDAWRTWPTYRIPLPHGRTVWIVFANFPDDPGIDYVLTDPAHPGSPRTLAATEGTFSGPALPWPDLLALAEAVPETGEGVRDPDRRLLLLLPAYGDVDPPARERTAAALTAIGVPARSAPALAEHLLDRHTPWTWDVSGTTPLSGAGTP